MAKSTVAVRFTGDTADLKRSLGQVEGGFGKMSGRAKVALAGAATAVVAFATTSVKAYAEAEQAQAELDQAFEKFPQLAGQNADALRELNTELAKKTRFDDDATASGQAVLAQFGLTADELERITPLMQDFAERTGQDLPSAASSLGKAILGQGRALKQVGIDFTDTGSKAGNLDAIMAGLETQVGGAAEAMGETAAGKAAILSNQFGELQEKVGSKLVPALSTLADVGIKVIGFLEDMPGPAKTAFAAFAVAGGAAYGVGKIAKAVSSTADALSGMVGPLRGATGGLSRMGAVAGALGLAAVTAGLIAMSREASETKIDVDGLTAALDDMTVANAASVQESIVGLAAMGELDNAVSQLAESNVETADAFIDAAEAAGVTADVIAELRRIVDDKRSSDTEGAAAVGVYASETEGATAAVEGQTEALWDGVAVMDAMLDATTAQFDSQIGYKRAVDGASDAVRDLATAQQEHGVQSEEYSDALLDAESAALQAGDAAVAMADAQYGAFISIEQRSQIYRAELVRQRDALKPGSPLWNAIDGYIKKLDAVPPKKKTEFELATDAAHRRLAYLRAALEAFRARAAMSGNIVDSPGLRQAATGGSVRKGEPLIVGEKRAELFVPNQNGTILPRVPTTTNGRAVAASAATTVNVYVAGSVLSERDLVATINRAVGKGIR